VTCILDPPEFERELRHSCARFVWSRYIYSFPFSLYLTEQNAAASCYAREAHSSSPSGAPLLVEVADCFDHFLPVSTTKLPHEQQPIR